MNHLRLQQVALYGHVSHIVPARFPCYYTRKITKVYYSIHYIITKKKKDMQLYKMLYVYAK